MIETLLQPLFRSYRSGAVTVGTALLALGLLGISTMMSIMMERPVEMPLRLVLLAVGVIWSLPFAGMFLLGIRTLRQAATV